MLVSCVAFWHQPQLGRARRLPDNPLTILPFEPTAYCRFDFFCSEMWPTSPLSHCRWCSGPLQRLAVASDAEKEGWVPVLWCFLGYRHVGCHGCALCPRNVPPQRLPPVSGTCGQWEESKTARNREGMIAPPPNTFSFPIRQGAQTVVKSVKTHFQLGDAIRHFLGPGQGGHLIPYRCIY